jgi:hypothetical protein
MGVGPCNQSIASGFGAAEIKSGFWRFLTVCLSRQNNQRQPMEGPLMAIKASLRADADSKKSLRSLARNQSHRAEPMHRA